MSDLASFFCKVSINFWIGFCIGYNKSYICNLSKKISVY